MIFAQNSIDPTIIEDVCVCARCTELPTCRFLGNQESRRYSLPQPRPRSNNAKETVILSGVLAIRKLGKAFLGLLNPSP